MPYTVPWVEGPDGLSLPYALDTKYGHLVFAYLGTGAQWEEFFAALAKVLASDFTFKLVSIATDSEDELGSILHGHLPGLQFTVVPESSGDFWKLSHELATGTIWKK
jgi:hypothetical protein